MVSEGGRRQSRRHHLAAVADAFLSPTPPRANPAPPAAVIAAPGPGTAAVPPVLIGSMGAERTCDLGAGVVSSLPRWEREGFDTPVPGSYPVLFWCVVGREATSLVAALALGRLAALLEPVNTTLLWTPAPDAAPTPPPVRGIRERARRLAAAAAPRARVAVHCVGWSRDATVDLQALAVRFA